MYCERVRKRCAVCASDTTHVAYVVRTSSSGSRDSSDSAGKMYSGKILESEGAKTSMGASVRVAIFSAPARTAADASDSSDSRYGTTRCEVRHTHSHRLIGSVAAGHGETRRRARVRTSTLRRGLHSSLTDDEENGQVKWVRKAVCVRRQRLEFALHKSWGRGCQEYAIELRQP